MIRPILFTGMKVGEDTEGHSDPLRIKEYIRGLDRMVAGTEALCSIW